MMYEKTSDFFYELPEELIAQTPAEPRDSSRLLVVGQDGLEHRIFRDIKEYFKPGDVLVINDTRVLPARLLGQTVHGGAMEFLLLKRVGLDEWEVLVKPGKKAKPGAVISFGEGLLKGHVLETTESGGRIVRFEYEGVFEELLEKLGQMPLPPYITKKLEDQTRYQTVYASHDGSAAAPTAGLHFTPELMEEIKAMGVTIVPVLLHVGLGSFRPVKAENIADHQMHSEYFEVSQESADIINKARKNGGRIICTGTTSVRTLESASDENGVKAMSGWTDIFITPGYKFKVVDKLITNFHLPESTLLMLVSAFAGYDTMMNAYKTAVDMRYRFFSFGDAMLLTRKEI